MKESVSLSIMGVSVLGIELGSSVLKANAFIHWGICPVPVPWVQNNIPFSAPVVDPFFVYLIGISLLQLQITFPNIMSSCHGYSCNSSLLIQSIFSISISTFPLHFSTTISGFLINSSTPKVILGTHRLNVSKVPTSVSSHPAGLSVSLFHTHRLLLTWWCQMLLSCTYLLKWVIFF